MKKLSKRELEKKEKRKKRREFKNEWRITRLEVLKRDNYECCYCGKDLKDKSGAAVAIHHIIPRQYKFLFLDIDNLITLCSYCHHWSRESPHQNGMYFALWFKLKYPQRYEYLINKLEEHKKPQPIEVLH